VANQRLGASPLHDLSRYRRGGGVPRIGPGAVNPLRIRPANDQNGLHDRLNDMISQINHADNRHGDDAFWRRIDRHAQMQVSMFHFTGHNAVDLTHFTAKQPQKIAA
jgi:hypothetical protein